MRYAVRRLLHDRSFALIAIVTLGLGIGANTAIFSLIKAVLLEPLPYGNPASVTLIWNAAEKNGMTWLSAQEIAGYRDATPGMAVGGYIESDGNFTGGQEPERVRIASVTADLFDILQAAPMLGRTFQSADGVQGQDQSIVLSHGLWQRRFGGDQGVIGKETDVNGRRRTIVGVMPAGFRLPLDFRGDRPTEAWVPVVLTAPSLAGWGNRSFIGVGRLRDGASPETATAQLYATSRRWLDAGFIVDNGDRRLADRVAMPATELLTGDARRPLFMLFATAGVVLLIAIANVVNLLLARGDARRQEAAIRAALGAGRASLVRQMLIESVMLAAAGAAFGLGLAWAGLGVLAAFQPANLPRAADARLDPIVLSFSALLALATGIVFGIAPALGLSRRRDLSAALRENTRGGTASRARQLMRGALVVSQVAMSVVLVLSAGLLGRSLLALIRIDPGFETSRVLTAEIQLPPTAYRTPEQAVAFYRQLVSRVSALPGVERAGAVRIVPFTRAIGDWSITIEGRPEDLRLNPNGDWQIATPGYFEALGVRPLAGRLITDADREDAMPVVIINDTMASRYWPGEDAIGKRFRLGSAQRPWLTIAGIIPTVRHNEIVEEPRAEMYVPHAQWHLATTNAARSMALVLKTASEPLALAGGVKSAVRALDPNLPVSAIQTMDTVMAKALSRPRFTASLLMVFAALALVLAAVGVYGMISLVVSERSREIGIRMALGARSGTILAMVMRRSLTLGVIGIAAGLGASALIAPLLESLLFAVKPLDPLTFAAVPGVLLLVIAAGSFAPARRASRVDPLIALR